MPALYAFAAATLLIGQLGDNPVTVGRAAAIAQACSESTSEAQPVALLPQEGGQVVCVNGRINRSMRDAFNAVSDEELAAASLVHVISEGGAVRYAIDIADRIHAAQIPVLTTGMCISACAQFIFLAGAPKIIAPGGAVAMHGGPLSADSIYFSDRDPEAKLSLLWDSLRFHEFFNRINVSIEVVRTPPDHVRERLAQGQIVFWSVRPEDYVRFGVHDVIRLSADSDAGEPSDAASGGDEAG